MPSKSAVYDAMSMRNRDRLARLGKRLTVARQRRNWTQSQLASKIGIAVGSLKKLESGTPNVPVAFLVEALDVLAMADDIDAIALPENDGVGQSIESPRWRQRVRHSSSLDEEFDVD